MTLTEELNVLFSQPYITLGTSEFSLGQVILLGLVLIGLVIIYLVFSAVKSKQAPRCE